MRTVKNRIEQPVKKKIKFYSIIQFLGIGLFLFSIGNYFHFEYCSNWIMLYSFILYLFGTLMGTEISIVHEEISDN